MARRLLAEGPLLALAGVLDLPDAPLRAALASAQLMGLAMARYVFGVEPLASMPPEALARARRPGDPALPRGRPRAPADGRGRG